MPEIPWAAPINVLLALLFAVAVGFVVRDYIRARRAGSNQAMKRLVMGILAIAVVGFILWQILVNTIGTLSR